MPSIACGFLIGILLLTIQSTLPDSAFVALLPACFFVLWKVPRLRFITAVLIGFLWAALRADLLLSQTLDPAVEGKTVVLEGRVAGLTTEKETGVRFELDVERLEQDGRRIPGPRRVRLFWRQPDTRLIPGETWRFAARLKRPHGFMNPGGFDYEGWLFRAGIRATGYVVAHDSRNSRVAPPVGAFVERLRLRLRDYLRRGADAREFNGILVALAMGDQTGIGAEQWRILTRTGTTHLIAISGLHVGLLAVIGYWLGRWTWPLLGPAPLYIAAPRIGALTGLMAAWLYAALAGFAIPTVRTVVMLAVLFAGLCANKRVASFELLSAALLAVLVYDPFAVLSAGFWLSFCAVATILYGMSGRVAARGLWWRYGRVHWVVGIGLTPLLLLLFGQNPLAGPLANLVAVPWITFVVVPMTLLGSALLTLWGAAGNVFLTSGDLALQALWPLLHWLAGFDAAIWSRPPPSLWQLATACAGAALLLAPRGLPLRWLGLLWTLPLIVIQPTRPGFGHYDFTLLDVGQGLAAVVVTRTHTLVFDTGPRYGDDLDAGRAVLLPYLRNRGIARLDIVILSHSDTDHTGGWHTLQEEIASDRVLASQPSATASPEASHCHAGQTWHWDGVAFEILHPETHAAPGDNARSCVLRVAGPGGVLLLTADIERASERRLIETVPDKLRADILVVPHHGSLTSSTEAFLRAVNPRYAVISAGYLNRFRFPRAEILARLARHGAAVYTTARAGALRFEVKDTIGTPLAYRHMAAKFWHMR